MPVTPESFRKLALSHKDAVESAHMGHPDFRVAGRIFATLGAPDDQWGMVKLTPEQQAMFLAVEKEVFRPAAGAWGRQGCTLVHLKKVRKQMLASAIEVAWQNAIEKGTKSPTRAMRTPAIKTPNGSKKPTGRTVAKSKSDSSLTQKVRAVCLAFPGSHETPTWGKPHFRIGEKIFAGLDDDLSVLGCKASKQDAARLVKLPGFSPAPYVGRHGWISIDLNVVTDWQHISELIANSFEFIASSSPKQPTKRRSSKP